MKWNPRSNPTSSSRVFHEFAAYEVDGLVKIAVAEVRERFQKLRVIVTVDLKCVMGNFLRNEGLLSSTIPEF